MECFFSKPKLLGLLGLTCVMVAAAYFCTTLPEIKAKIAGWVGLVLFGLGFIRFPIMLLNTAPQVIINDHGIDDRRMKIGIIDWKDIRSLSIRSISSNRFLCVEVFDREKYMASLPKWQRKLTIATTAIGVPAFTISFTGLTPGIDEVWLYLQSQAIKRQVQFRS